MGKSINTELHESTPFIEPNGKYILYVSIIEKKDCILIAYKNNDGSWNEPINITNIYPEIFGTCPRVTPDKKNIFFNRYENKTANVYWVSSQVIDELWPK